MKQGAGAQSDSLGLQHDFSEGHSFEGAGKLAPENVFPVDGRWRDLFPLPEMVQKAGPSNGHAFSVHAKRRYRRRLDNFRKANCIIRTLNEMNGFSSPSTCKLSASQEAAHHQILRQVVDSPRADRHVQVREAVHELLHVDLSTYVEEEVRSTVRSYCRESVSLPETGAQVFQAQDLLDDTGREILLDPQGHLFVGEVHHESKLKPYMDDILRLDSSAYHQFIFDLWAKGMLTFGQRKSAEITPFFVSKKDGRLRLVLDCRATNSHFKSPPDIAMAAGYTFGQLFVEGDQKVYTAQSDIKDYFYSIGLPEYLHSFFSLPPIRPSTLRGLAMQQGTSIVELRGWGDDELVYPQMKVVPMGWSWAMYFAQRIHQHQVMIGTGAKAEQILADGRPAPSLSSGVPVLVPYADNLNVIGTDPVEVQRYKDLAVQRLRQVGFRVHEEEDASVKVRALGFIIDGETLAIHPRPDKRDRIIQALRWLSTSPRVSGKAVERIIGHCVHLMMLRREFLAVFRSVYDFKSAHYHKPQRLWRSAATECRWAADLLVICQSELSKPWNDTLTVSDACLSGTAVCSMKTHPSCSQQLGQQRELWRYRSSNPAVKARDCVKKLDPFHDVETVLDMQSFHDPFQLNHEFQNVPEDLAKSPDWKWQFSCRMHKKEHITLLEGRATVQAIRHLARSTRHFGKRHVHLGDNLGMVLAFDRGRAKVFPLLICCRRIAAYGVAMGTQFCHRWIPSEWNAADAPSRQWESEEAQPKVSAKTRQKKIDSIIYPRTKAQKEGQSFLLSAVLRENAKRKCDQGFEGGSPSGTASTTKDADVSNSFGSSGKDSTGETEQEIKMAPGSSITATLPRSNSFGATSCIPNHSSGLPKANHGVSRILQNTCPEDSHILSGRSSLRPLPERCIRRGLGHLRGPEVLCSSLGSISCGGKVRFSPEQAGFKGMAERRPRSVQDTLGLAIHKLGCPDNVVHGSAPHCPLHFDNVCGLPAPIRSVEDPKSRSGSVRQVGKELGLEPQSFRNSRPKQSGAHRRISPVGLPRGQVSGKGAHEDQKHMPKSLAIPNLLFESPQSLEGCSSRLGAERRLRCSPPATPLRSQLGSHETSQTLAGNKAPREVGLRCQPQALRESCQDCSALREAAKGDQEESRGISRVVVGNGYRIFVPVSPNGRKPALEIFAGSAAWSKAMCRQGFTVHAFDLRWGSGGDLLNYNVFHRVLDSIRCKAFCYVHFGMPGDSWSLARKWDGGPPPLRDGFSNLYGFSYLTGCDKQKVLTGNHLLKCTFKLALACFEHGIPGSIENPSTSRAWLTREMRSLVHRGATFQLVHYCQYGKLWKKATNFLTWLSPDFRFRQCAGKHGACSATQQFHVLLQGKNAQGIFKTLIAQPYPVSMVNSIAHTLRASL